MFHVPRQTAEHYAILVPVTSRWSGAINVMKSTLSLDLFDLSFWSGERYAREKLFYARCLMSACVTVLKTNGVLEDFKFSLGEEFTEEGVVISSAVSILKAFASSVLPHARQTLGTWRWLSNMRLMNAMIVG